MKGRPLATVTWPPAPGCPMPLFAVWAHLDDGHVEVVSDLRAARGPGDAGELVGQALSAVVEEAVERLSLAAVSQPVAEAFYGRLFAAILEGAHGDEAIDALLKIGERMEREGRRPAAGG